METYYLLLVGHKCAEPTYISTSQVLNQQLQKPAPCVFVFNFNYCVGYRKHLVICVTTYSS